MRATHRQGRDRPRLFEPDISVELFHEDVAVLGTTLTGLSCLPERSVRRSGVTGSPLPPRRALAATRCSVVRSASGRRPKRLPQAWAPLRAFLRSSGPRHHDRGLPSWGSSPLRRRGLAGPLFPGMPPRHVPPPRFRTSSAVSSPLALRPRGPLPSMGFLRHSETPSVAEPPRLRVAASALLRGHLPQGFRSPSSEEQEEEDTATPDRSRPVRPGPDVGRRPDRSPGAFPSGALHPDPARRPASPPSPSRALALGSPP